MSLPVRLLIGALLAASISVIARRARSLSTGGAAAAVVVGTAAVAAGWDWAGLLLAYFVSSSALSRWGRGKKAERTEGMVAKAGPRDAWQVLSNGLPFLVAASGLALGLIPLRIAHLVAAGGLAASAADTWATEIGTLFGGIPRSILTGRALSVGESGGISLQGTVATILGACFVAVLPVISGWGGSTFLPIAAGGAAGSIADSLLGAVLQRRNWCDACGVRTEMNPHRCGSTTRKSSGISFVENDAVNLIATIVGASVAVMIA
jgi:uncharacterized protein (TIGR00297 family)